MRAVVVCLLLLAAMTGAVYAATAPLTPEDMAYAVTLVPDVTYNVASGKELKLDIFGPTDNLTGPAEKRKPVPTIVWFHGGGWMWGRKEVVMFGFLPFLARGWAVVNANYRLSGDAQAPAAAEDARCAVWWVKRNAAQYGFDSERIIVAGGSAGATLALLAGMAPAGAQLDSYCPLRKGGDVIDRETGSQPELQVAAILNFGGLTDVTELIQGPEMKAYALTWIGGSGDRMALARRVSPITYVRGGLPPILTVHGDQDRSAPYHQAVRLHQALQEKGVPNRLYTVKGREHYTDFLPQEYRDIFKVVFEFLAQYVPER
jgi:acetyl esterase/lipase